MTFQLKKISNIFFSKIQICFEKYLSNLIFTMIKNKLRFFLDIYIDVKFHALSIYEVFRAIRARQTTLWSLVRCWYQKCLFFILNAISGPPARWILCTGGGGHGSRWNRRSGEMCFAPTPPPSLATR